MIIILQFLPNFAVKALKAIKKSLTDPNKNLSNWNKGDPCNANWTGVICYNTTLGDDYLHVEELYAFNHSIFVYAMKDNLFCLLFFFVSFFFLLW